jgi:hypothetical protein
MFKLYKMKQFLIFLLLSTTCLLKAQQFEIADFPVTYSHQGFGTYYLTEGNYFFSDVGYTGYFSHEVYDRVNVNVGVSASVLSDGYDIHGYFPLLIGVNYGKNGYNYAVPDDGMRAGFFGNLYVGPYKVFTAAGASTTTVSLTTEIGLRFRMRGRDMSVSLINRANESGLRIAYSLPPFE